MAYVTKDQKINDKWQTLYMGKINKETHICTEREAASTASDKVFSTNLHTDICSCRVTNPT